MKRDIIKVADDLATNLRKCALGSHARIQCTWHMHTSTGQNLSVSCIMYEWTRGCFMVQTSLLNFCGIRKESLDQIDARTKVLKNIALF